jgi:butyryl-CoA dehydrogenase
MQERQQFGKALVEFQAVQSARGNADARRRREAADSSRRLQRADRAAGILESSVAKCFANEIAREVCGHAVQLMGGYGCSRVPDGTGLRDAWGWGIAGGAVDIQKVNIAGAMVGKRFDQRR